MRDVLAVIVATTIGLFIGFYSGEQRAKREVAVACDGRHHTFVYGRTAFFCAEWTELNEEEVAEPVAADVTEL